MRTYTENALGRGRNPACSLAGTSTHNARPNNPAASGRVPHNALAHHARPHHKHTHRAPSCAPPPTHARTARPHTHKRKENRTGRHTGP